MNRWTTKRPSLVNPLSSMEGNKGLSCGSTGHNHTCMSHLLAAFHTTFAASSQIRLVARPLCMRSLFKTPNSAVSSVSLICCIFCEHVKMSIGGSRLDLSNEVSSKEAPNSTKVWVGSGLWESRSLPTPLIAPHKRGTPKQGFCQTRPY